MKSNKKAKTTAARFLIRTAAILFWIGIWAAAAAMINKPLLLPSPLAAFGRLVELAIEKTFWLATGATFLRIASGLICGIVAGCLLAAVCFRFKTFDTLLSPMMTVIKATPVASFIILVLLWIGRDSVPIIITFLMVVPIVWHNVKTGLASSNPALLEVARVYGVTGLKRWKHNYLPAALPYFFSAVRASIGLGWKAGIAAEVLTVPVRSIGTNIFESKTYMETTDLFAWTLLVILLSIALEKVIMLTFRKIENRFGKNG